MRQDASLQEIYNPVMEVTTVRAREKVCAYGILVAIGLRTLYATNGTLKRQKAE